MSVETTDRGRTTSSEIAARRILTLVMHRRAVYTDTRPDPWSGDRRAAPIHHARVRTKSRSIAPPPVNSTETGAKNAAGDQYE